LKKKYNLEEAEPDVAYITNIIMNPMHYKPRKNININENDSLKRVRNKYDVYTPTNKRQKSHSFHYQNLHFNKNYDVFPKGDSCLILDITNVYTLEDMTRICLNMDLLKRFEMPEEFKNKFVGRMMRESPKETLDMYKRKKERAISLQIERSGMY
jgi:hypothetical protein